VSDGSEHPEHPEGAGAGHEAQRLEALRRRIVETDEAIVRLVGERRDLVLEIGRVKEAMGRPVLDPAREAAVVRRAARLARERGVDEEMVRDVLWRVIASAREAQEGRSSWGPPERPSETEAGETC
jgi:chorismate mutase